MLTKSRIFPSRGVTLQIILTCKSAREVWGGRTGESNLLVEIFGLEACRVRHTHFSLCVNPRCGASTPTHTHPTVWNHHTNTQTPHCVEPSYQHTHLTLWNHHPIHTSHCVEPSHQYTHTPLCGTITPIHPPHCVGPWHQYTHPTV